MVRTNNRTDDSKTTQEVRGKWSADQLLTLADVADRLQVSVRTVRRMVADGLLPLFRFSGKLLRFHIQDVETALGRVRIPARTEMSRGTNVSA